MVIYSKESSYFECLFLQKKTPIIFNSFLKQKVFFLLGKKLFRKLTDIFTIHIQIGQNLYAGKTRERA